MMTTRCSSFGGCAASAPASGAAPASVPASPPPGERAGDEELLHAALSASGASNQTKGRGRLMVFVYTVRGLGAVSCGSAGPGWARTEQTWRIPSVSPRTKETHSLDHGSRA